MTSVARDSVVSLLWLVFSWWLAAIAGAAIMIVLYMLKSAPLLLSSGIADAFAFVSLEVADHSALSSMAFLTAAIFGTAFGFYGVYQKIAHDINPFVMVRDMVRIRGR